MLNISQMTLFLENNFMCRKWIKPFSTVKKTLKKYIHICTISRIVSWGRDDRPAQSPLSHCPVSGVWSLSLYTVSLRSAASSQPRPPAPALIVKVGAAPIQKISGEQVICRILSLNSIELWRSRLNDWMSLTFFKSNLFGLSPPPPNSSNFFKRLTCNLALFIGLVIQNDKDQRK